LASRDATLPKAEKARIANFQQFLMLEALVKAKELLQITTSNFPNCQFKKWQ
jgi:hypothetical protein